MENYRDILDSSHESHAKREIADCKLVGIEPARAAQTPRPAGLVRMSEEGSFALVPSAGSARRKRVLVRLFGAAHRRGIE
jgi:hypothetical protein